MAGHVFICKWKKTGGQWHLWVKGRPQVSGQGETFEAAQLALEQAIWDDAENGDDVIPTVMEFEPALPMSEGTKKFFTPEIYNIYGDERFELLRGNFPYGQVDESTMAYVHSLYEGGICKSCSSGIGKRTEVEFRTERKIESSDGLWLFHCQIKADAYFFSDRFISLLTDKELERLKFRDCVTTQKRGRKYYELAGDCIASAVGVKCFDSSGRECRECGKKFFSVADRNMDFSMQSFLCRSDLPDPLPSCFAANISNRPTLCMTRERWDQIRGNKNAKGLISERIGIADEELCDRFPRLYNSSKDCETCSKWQREEDSSRKLPITDIEELNNLPAVRWFKKEMENPQTIIITRQEDTVDHIIEMSREKKAKEGKTISFRCPECWKLGRFILMHDTLGLYW